MVARKELAQAVAARYRASPRGDRGAILDKFVATTGYHRKHAIRLLAAEPNARSRAASSGWLAGACRTGSKSHALGHTARTTRPGSSRRTGDRADRAAPGRLRAGNRDEVGRIDRAEQHAYDDA